MQLAVANPVRSRKPKRTKSLKSAKRSVRKASKAKRKRRNAWFGERARHSKARKSGHAGPTYKTNRRRSNPLGIVTNPTGGSMKKKHRKKSGAKRSKAGKRIVRRVGNPAGTAQDAMKFFGGALIGGFATRIIASKVGPMVEGVLPENMKQFAKPAVGAAVTAAVFLAGDQLFKDDKMRMGALAGSGFAAAEGIIKALAPDVAQSFLSDIGAIEISQPLQDIAISDDNPATALLSDEGGLNDGGTISEDLLFADDGLGDDTQNFK